MAKNNKGPSHLMVEQTSSNHLPRMKPWLFLLYHNHILMKDPYLLHIALQGFRLPILLHSLDRHQLESKWTLFFNQFKTHQKE
jgi:hypothetical protein